jgi:DNA-binding response OmpR family regulator
MHLLLIEDSPRLQGALSKGFERAGYAVDVVGEGDRGLVFARRRIYDVIILDLMLPGLPGLELLRQLRQGGSDAHVLILTARDGVEDRVRGLQLGADDYLVKPFSFDELLARVQALVRRKFQSKSPDLVVGDLAIDTVARRVVRAGQEIALTRREFTILEYLARKCGATVSRVEIEDHVYGEQNLPSSNAVDSAICNLRKKLAASPEAPELIHTHHGFGYSLGQTPP